MRGSLIAPPWLLSSLRHKRLPQFRRQRQHLGVVQDPKYSGSFLNGCNNENASEGTRHWNTRLRWLSRRPQNASLPCPPNVGRINSAIKVQSTFSAILDYNVAAHSMTHTTRRSGSYASGRFKVTISARRMSQIGRKFGKIDGDVPLKLSGRVMPRCLH